MTADSRMDRSLSARVADIRGRLDADSPDATVSAGAAVLDHLDIDIEAAQTALIQAADDALYAAKRRGRDQTFVTSAMATGLVAGPLEI